MIPSWSARRTRHPAGSSSRCRPSAGVPSRSGRRSPPPAMPSTASIEGLGFQRPPDCRNPRRRSRRRQAPPRGRPALPASGRRCRRFALGLPRQAALPRPVRPRRSCFSLGSLLEADAGRGVPLWRPAPASNECERTAEARGGADGWCAFTAWIIQSARRFPVANPMCRWRRLRGMGFLAPPPEVPTRRASSRTWSSPCSPAAGPPVTG